MAAREKPSFHLLFAKAHVALPDGEGCRLQSGSSGFDSRARFAFQQKTVFRRSFAGEEDIPQQERLCSFMGTFKDLVTAGEGHATVHNRARWYRVNYLSIERGRLKEYIESHATDNWYVEVQSTAAGFDSALIKYGPVHGNYPSDVSRLFRQANVKLVSVPEPQGDPEHAIDECRHVNCKK
jgi:hypothetical protein